jgi:C-terminal domain 7 of the ABC-three component (ABC-3C) systems
METPSTEHSAAESAVGYVYQCYLPLLLLAERASREPELTLALELLDDVQFEEHGSAKELIQTKHHLQSQGDLTDASVDLWRTINAWISVLEELTAEETPALTLITTGVAPGGSAASYLRDDDDRDPDRAQASLLRAAASSTNQTTARWRARFAQLSPNRRQQLVSAITVADGAIAISDIDDRLKTALFWALPSTDRADAFIEHVRGWWFGIAVRLLRRQVRALAATDMLRAIQDIRDQFGPENLPRDPDLPDPDEVTVAGFQTRVFVRQLELIASTQEQLALAIRDYYRAFTQRSRWLRRDLVGVDEIDRFEANLVDEWRFVFTNLTAELAADAHEPEKQRHGRRILARAAETARARIREHYDESFMTRGSLHGLADDRRVGWHPEFEARLEALLSPVVESA